MAFLKKHGVNILKIILVLIFAVIWVMFVRNPGLTEKIFSSDLFVRFSGPLASLGNIFFFSVGEIFMWAFPILLIVAAIRYVSAALFNKNKEETLRKKRNIFSNVFIVLFIMFSISSGYNYFRQPLSESMAVDMKKRSEAELIQTCASLAEDVNKQRNLINSDENGNMVLKGTFKDVFSHAKNGFDKVSEDYSFIPQVYAVPKTIKTSKNFSQFGASGIYFSLLNEASVNVDIPNTNIPFAVCCELSKSVGFVRSADAEFLAYMACMKNDSAEYKYSAALQAFMRCADVLLEVNPAQWENIWNKLSFNARMDILDSEQYWQNMHGTYQDFTDSVSMAIAELQGGNKTDDINEDEFVKLLIGYKLKVSEANTL